MVSAKRLAQLANKWQRMVAIGRKRITQTTTAKKAAAECRTVTSVAVKGHCMVYTSDGSRFEVPVEYLSTAVFSELLRMSQEEFGFEGGDNGRITLPCDTAVMEYAMCLLRRDASMEVVMAFLSSIARPCCFDGGVVVPCVGLNHYLIHHQQSITTSIAHFSEFLAEKQDPGPTMVSTKRLAQLAKKWQRMATIEMKSLTTTAKEDEEFCTSIAVKGHFVMYTADGRRFKVPLVYQELPRMFQEEFSFASDGNITLPCDATMAQDAYMWTQRGKQFFF
ncbi:auxin-responsive protein SAUR36-like [Hordeum vulgare]|nr:auxin-responsive protein SAUR36-like [Hordeum vulgare]